MSTGALHEPFEDLGRQRDAAEFGMWVFLASEVVFFGAMFAGYAVYRHQRPEGFAVAGQHVDLVLGSINTILLLTSSGTMSVAAWSARANLRQPTMIALAATLLLGLGFLGVKALEYQQDLHEHLWPGDPMFPSDLPGARSFFAFYWLMTSVHAIHLSIGIAAVSITLVRMRLRRAAWHRSGLLHALALYWHLVDVIWIFLFPLLYLVGRSA
ncbi:MAG: cytochrome c oxidase subunit 3 [Burkholderiaceae bacterium]